VPVTIRVATLNVGGLPGPLPPLADRLAELGRRLDESDLDVVMLQEVWWPRALATARGRLRSYPHVAWRRGVGGRPAGGVVTLSRRPLARVTYQSFRGVVPDAGGVPFRVRLAVNSALQGVLTAELSGLRTVVANTHVTANKDGDWSVANRHHGFQRAQLRRVQDAVRRAGAGLWAGVLAGDFNIASDSALYPAIVDNGRWRDPFARTDPATFLIEYLPAVSTAHRIDYLLTTGEATATDPEVLFAERVDLPGGRRAHLSDHVGLAASITLPG
jgi:endonuclease/exonuclease/phosphatase family metal-dependent hydrolase